MDVCREVVPPEVRFADGVRVACHLFPTPAATAGAPLAERRGPRRTPPGRSDGAAAADGAAPRRARRTPPTAPTAAGDEAAVA